MKTIPLTQGQVALVDDEDYERLSKFKWYAQRQRDTFYAKRNVRLPDGKRAALKMHREILGLTDPKILVDHRDHDGLHNWRHNLRMCNKQQNMRNQRKHQGTTSVYKGVSFVNREKKWVSQIGINKKRIRLGYFSFEVDAARAYDAAALKYFGEFACLNFAAETFCYPLQA